MKQIIYVMLAVLLVQVAMAATASSIQVTMLSQNPDPAHAGDVVDVRLRIENQGDQAANNFQINVTDTYPFTIVETPSQVISTISAADRNDNYISLTYRIKVANDAPNGQYDLNVQYKKDNQDWTLVKLPVDVTSNNYAQIDIDKSSLQPGEETPIKFMISNTGKTPIQNLQFSWSNPDGTILPVYSDNIKYIDYLGVGKSMTLDYTVVADVNSKPGLYKLDLNLKYNTADNATPVTIQTTAGITIGGQTDFDVSFSESTAGQTSLAVSNIGNNPALSVSVRVPDQPGYRVSGSPTAIIGNLDKGDYTIVSFQIVTSNSTNVSRTGGAPGAFNGTRNFNITRSQGTQNGLQVFVDYTDTTGKRQTVEKIVPIQFRSGSSGVFTAGTGTRSAATTTSSSILTNPIFIVAIVVAVVGGVWYWRRHKKAKSR